MKKNLGLFFIFVILCLIAYQSEEIDKIKEKNNQKQSAKLFSFSKLGKIKELVTPNASLVWREGRVFSKKTGIIVSKYHLETLLDILANIEIKRHLKEAIKPDSSFSMYRDFLGEKPLSFSFIFSKGVAKFTIGKKLEYSQSFYILVEVNNENKKLVIAQDKTPLEGVYQKEGFETNSRKYKRLTSLLYLKDSYFYERLVFSNLIQARKISKIGFLSFRNPEFFVDIINNTTLPRPPKGIEINQKSINHLIRNLHNLTAKHVTKLSKEKTLSEPKGKIYIYYANQNKVEFNLYSKLGEGKGLYIKRDSQAFTINKLDYPLLYSHLQEFWLKKLPFPVKESPLSFFLKKRQIYKGKVNKKVINLITRDKKRVELSAILSYFIKTADKVSMIDLDIKKILKNDKSNHVLHMKYQGHIFSMIFEKNGTMIVSIKDGHVLHFDGNDMNSFHQFTKKYKGL